MTPFKKLKSYLRLRRAIILADQQYQQTGTRHYVMPAIDGTLIVMSKKDFRTLKRKHYIPQRATTRDLTRECFYHTPYADGTGTCSPTELRLRKAFYYQWCQNHKKK